MACGGKPSSRKDRGAELALEGEIVDGDHRRHADRRAEAHIGQRQRRLPVMGMDDIRRIAGDRAGGDVGADLARAAKRRQLSGQSAPAASP